MELLMPKGFDARRAFPFSGRGVLLLLTFAGFGTWNRPTGAAESFVLENDIGITARFDFYAKDDATQQEPPLVPPKWVQPRRHALVNLPVDGEVVFRYTKVDNTASDSFLWDPGPALATSPLTPPRVTFKGIVHRSIREQRTKEVTVKKSVPEERTRTVRVKKLKSEQRTRLVKKRDPKTGNMTWQEESYTVQIPYTEEVEQTYTVCVPVTETKTIEYTVVTPVAVARFSAGGVDFNASQTMGGDALGHRQRVLGITLEDHRGALVTSITPGSAATRMALFGPHANPQNRYALEPGVDRIVRVNGVRVRTTREVVEAVQKSPVVCILTVRNRSGEQAYEAALDLVEVRGDFEPAPAP
jgi:hypothetical protein